MTNRYPLKQFPIVGACGLDCGLCPRYHTDGKVKCPGCCGPDFYDKHVSCGLVNCCVRERGLESCALCTYWQECQKIFGVLEASQTRDSFISYRPLHDNFSFIKNNGISEFVKQEIEKQKFLLHLLDNYDDGRSKLFYCTACQLIPTPYLNLTIKGIENKITNGADIKERSKLMRGAINKLADKLSVNLKLRKFE